MKVTLLNGSLKDNGFGLALQDLVLEELDVAGSTVVTHILRDLEIAPCTGCFGCWVKTPGICVIDDIARQIAGDIVGNEWLVMITPVTFGGYSSQLKKALDRIISIILPFFNTIHGETHHQTRYQRYPNLLMLGFLPASHPEQEQTFRRLVARNAINLHSQKTICHIFLETESAESMGGKIRAALQKMGEKS